MASLVKTDKISKIAGGSQEFVLPGADGTANQHLKTDGAGNLGWASAPSITGSTNTWIPTITGANALAGTANFTYDGNVLDVKNSGTASSINLYCETSNLHYIKLKSGPHASATSYTLTLPNAPPSVTGQALTATTAGVASWAAKGKILQVTSASLSTETRTTSTSFVTSGMTATFASLTSGSLVAIFLAGGSMLAGSWTSNTTVKFYSSVGGAAYAAVSTDPQEYIVWAGTGGTVEGFPHSMNYLTNPGSTSSFAVTPYFKASSGDNQYFNEAGYTVSMILMEIGA